MHVSEFESNFTDKNILDFLTLLRCHPAKGFLFSCQIRSLVSFPKSGSSTCEITSRLKKIPHYLILDINVCAVKIWETYHEPVHLSLLKIVRLVVQSDLVALALVSVHLEGDTCIGSCAGQV